MNNTTTTKEQNTTRNKSQKMNGNKQIPNEIPVEKMYVNV